jgi:hypothetical protein
VNVSRAIIENMTAEQDALDKEIQATIAKLHVLQQQRSQNALHIALAREFGVVAGQPDGSAHD